MEGVLKQPREHVFQAAAALGFDGIEIEAHGDRELLRAWQAESGVRVCSLICGGEGLGSNSVEARATARERLLGAVSDAAALHAGGLLLPLFQPASLDDTARLVEDLRACMPLAEEHQVVVGWENAMDAADTRAVIERVGSEQFRCYFDFANAAKRGADPARELRDLGPLVYQVHAKNVDKLPLDAPGVDLRECLGALKAGGFAGWVVLETPAGEDPLASAARNLRVVREAWAQA
jgi:sugar phosphate isomerase/epimerase